MYSPSIPQPMVHGAGRSFNALRPPTVCAAFPRPNRSSHEIPKPNPVHFLDHVIIASKMGSVVSIDCPFAGYYSCFSREQGLRLRARDARTSEMATAVSGDNSKIIKRGR